MSTNQKVQRNDNKAKELLLYIVLLSEGDDNFGATKLNKLMFFSDFIYYLNSGNAITGQEYVKRDGGPMLNIFYKIKDDLLENGAIAFRIRDRFGKTQHRIFALREPDLSQFSATEIDLVNRVITEFMDMNATQISHESHKFMGWESAEINEVIPYETALLGTRELTEAEFDYADTLEPLAAELLAG